MKLEFSRQAVGKYSKYRISLKSVQCEQRRSTWKEAKTDRRDEANSHFLQFLRMLLKGKAVPLQAWTGPEGSRKLRLPYFVTMAQDGGKVVSLTHRPPSPPGNTPGTHFC